MQIESHTNTPSKNLKRNVFGVDFVILENMSLSYLLVSFLMFCDYYSSQGNYLDKQMLGQAIMIMRSHATQSWIQVIAIAYSCDSPTFENAPLTRTQTVYHVY